MAISKSNKIRLDIVMIVFILLFPHAGLLPMYVYPFVVLFICWLYLRLYKKDFSSIGFRFSDLSLKTFYIGCLAGLAYACFDFWLFEPLLHRITGFAKANVSDFNFIKRSLPNYLFLLFIAWVIVIPYEEIVFRGFIFSKIRDLSPRSTWRFAISALITSVLFGFYHIQEGASGVLNAFIFGLVVNCLLPVFKGNLWYLIFFHIAYDTFMLTAIKLGYM